MNINLKYIRIFFGLFVILGFSLNQPYATVWYYSPEGEPRFRTQQDFVSYGQACERSRKDFMDYQPARGGRKPAPGFFDVVIGFFVPTAVAIAVASAPQRKRVCGLF